MKTTNLKQETDKIYLLITTMGSLVYSYEVESYVIEENGLLYLYAENGKEPSSIFNMSLVSSIDIGEEGPFDLSTVEMLGSDIKDTPEDIH